MQAPVEGFREHEIGQVRWEIELDRYAHRSFHARQLTGGARGEQRIVPRSGGSRSIHDLSR
ncbi:MAG: hypothetical protein U0359_08025 [Byssovorax sp.]